MERNKEQINKLKTINRLDLLKKEYKILKCINNDLPDFKERKQEQLNKKK